MILDNIKIFLVDIAYINSFFKNPFMEEEERIKVDIAAIRIFAVLGMAFSAIIAFGAFKASAAGAVFRLGFAVSLYAVSHDVFVIVKNSERGLGDQIVASGRGLFKDFCDFLNGEKNLGDPLRHPFTEGTFFRPFWDKTIAQMSQE